MKTQDKDGGTSSTSAGKGDNGDRLAVGSDPSLHRMVARAIMLKIQFADLGHYEERDGERCYVSTGAQIRELERVCDEAATAAVALIPTKTVITSMTPLTEEDILAWHAAARSAQPMNLEQLDEQLRATATPQVGTASKAESPPLKSPSTAPSPSVPIEEVSLETLRGKR